VAPLDTTAAEQTAARNPGLLHRTRRRPAKRLIHTSCLLQLRQGSHAVLLLLLLLLAAGCTS
jgi:hypothetical protein